MRDTWMTWYKLREFWRRRVTGRCCRRCRSFRGDYEIPGAETGICLFWKDYRTYGEICEYGKKRG